LILLLGVLAGNFFRYVSPQSFRPSGKQALGVQEEKIACRLWQDPYEIALTHLNTSEESYKTLKSAVGITDVCQQIQDITDKKETYYDPNKIEFKSVFGL